MTTSAPAVVAARTIGRRGHGRRYTARVLPDPASLPCISASRTPPDRFSSRRPWSVGSERVVHELRLLKLLVEGCSYKTAAAALGATAKTVSFQRLVV